MLHCTADTSALLVQDEADAPSSPPPAPVQNEQPAVRGQTTAIVTGVVSIAFGVRFVPSCASMHPDIELHSLRCRHYALMICS